MYRITIRNRFAAAILSAVVLAGCGKEYPRQNVPADAKQAAEVRSMIEALRQAGEARLDESMRQQAAAGLDERQREALAAMLKQIILAEKVELTNLDQFGRKVYRASLQLTFESASNDLVALLVQADGALRWAGPN